MSGPTKTDFLFTISAKSAMRKHLDMARRAESRVRASATPNSGYCKELLELARLHRNAADVFSMAMSRRGRGRERENGMRKKREVFHGIQVQPPIYAPAMAGGCGVPGAFTETTITYNIPVYHSGDMLINIPPLKRFNAGDKVRVTVELEQPAPQTKPGGSHE